MKKIISLILSVTMVFTLGAAAFSTNAYAAEKAPEQAAQTVISGDAVKDTVIDIAEILAAHDIFKTKLPTSKDGLGDFFMKILYKLADTIIDLLLYVINHVIPSVQFEPKEEYKNEQFFEGMSDYLTAPAAGAAWSLGYASASLQTGDELDGNHFVGGSLSFPKTKAATAIHDDQRVRCIAINDGSGRGTIVFAVIDGFGFSNTDVMGVRAQLADFAKKNNIVGINISVLHQHSCVDTFGMNGDLLKMVFTNPAINISNSLFGTDFALLNGQNKAFMENLYKVTVESVESAVNSMTAGKIYYSEIDATEFIRDKREPMVNDNDIHRFRFVPDDRSLNETWICNSAIHCVGNGAAGTEITGDYPYYMEQVINDRADANFILLQGAELAITSTYSKYTEEEEALPRIEKLKIYGKALGDLVVDSTAPETEVAPLLNFKMKQYYVPVKNQILCFAGKLGALTNTVLSVGGDNCDLELITELGYLEIGTDLAVALIPGELEPAIAYGGYLNSDNSWKGEDFDYPTLQEIVGTEKDLLVFGLMNDQIGYILEDNDYSSILSGVNEEIVATGDVAGSKTIEAFGELVDSIG